MAAWRHRDCIVVVVGIAEDIRKVVAEQIVVGVGIGHTG